MIQQPVLCACLWGQPSAHVCGGGDWEVGEGGEQMDSAHACGCRWASVRALGDYLAFLLC